MDSVWMILAFGLLFLAVVVLLAVVVSCKRPKVPVQPVVETEGKTHMEFMKVMMLMVLAMWVVGGISGIGVVLFCDVTYLDRILEYIQNPVNIGLGVYAVKSGAENCKKIAQGKTTENVAPDYEGDYNQ